MIFRYKKMLKISSVMIMTFSSVSDSPDPFSPTGSNKAAVKFTLSKSASVTAGYKPVG